MRKLANLSKTLILYLDLWSLDFGFGSSKYEVKKFLILAGIVAEEVDEEIQQMIVKSPMDCEFDRGLKRGLSPILESPENKLSKSNDLEPLTVVDVVLESVSESVSDPIAPSQSPNNVEEKAQNL